MEHINFIKTILRDAIITKDSVQLFRIPLPKSGTINEKGQYMHLYFSRSNGQITIDVCENGRFLYSGVHAADMSEPMCPANSAGLIWDKQTGTYKDLNTFPGTK